MIAVDRPYNRRLAYAVLGSFIFCAMVVIVRVGLGATPYETTDSLGHPMGFNDPLYAEHYLIMLDNFNLKALLNAKYAYEWLLAVAHVAGIVLLLSKRFSTRLVRWYFAAQAFIFPFGLPAAPIFFMMLFGFLTGQGTDREGFIDVPFIIVAAHPLWVMVSLYITFALRGEGLGVARVWGGLVQFWRAGSKGFADAIR